MTAYENNAYFWQKIDTFFLSGQLKVLHKKGETHPKFSNMIYPVDFGRLTDISGTNPDGVSVYLGSNERNTVTCLIVAADILEKSLDVKILARCTEEEEIEVLHFLNQTDYQKTVLIRRGSEIPGWSETDN